jgi:hypothetical protein
MGSWFSYHTDCSPERAREIAASEFADRCDLTASGARVEGVLKLDRSEASFRQVIAVTDALTALARRFDVRWTVQFEGPGEITAEGPAGEFARALQQMRGLVDWVDRRTPWSPQSNKSLSRVGAKKLAARWTAEAARAVCEAIFGESGAAPRIGGRIDARGLDLATLGRAIPRARSGRYMGPVIRGVDFSFLVTVRTDLVSFGGITFEDCVFDGLKTVDLAGTFARCSLRGLEAAQVSASIDGCDLSMSRIDGFLPNARDAIFSFSRLDGCNLHHLSYSRCRFDHASLNDTELGWARFEECTFEGASFYNAFYSKTRFARCIGLHQSRMLETARVMFGHALSTSDDLVIDD